MAHELNKPSLKLSQYAKTHPNNLFFTMKGKTGEYIIDSTEYESKHPGGKAILQRFRGQDITEPFAKMFHSLRAKQIVKTLVVAKLLPEENEFVSDEVDLFEENLRVNEDKSEDKIVASEKKRPSSAVVVEQTFFGRDEYEKVSKDDEIHVEIRESPTIAAAVEVTEIQLNNETQI